MTPKLAFCFLTYNSIKHPKLWDRFLDKSRSNVYVHNKENFKCPYFDKYIIHQKCKTAWGHISLVEATLLLFKEALLNTDNEYFILVSDKCIPVQTFEYVYYSILDMNTNILFEVNNERTQRLCHARKNSMRDKTFFSDIELRKQSQWMILKRQTVEFLMHANFLHKFGLNSQCPDEHYFINICTKYKIPYLSKLSTFVKWPRGGGNHPYTFTTLNENVIQKVRSTGAYFMRKIDANCHINDSLIEFICGIQEDDYESENKFDRI